MMEGSVQDPKSLFPIAPICMFAGIFMSAYMAYSILSGKWFNPSSAFLLAVALGETVYAIYVAALSVLWRSAFIPHSIIFEIVAYLLGYGIASTGLYPHAVPIASMYLGFVYILYLIFSKKTGFVYIYLPDGSVNPKKFNTETGETVYRRYSAKIHNLISYCVLFVMFVALYYMTVALPVNNEYLAAVATAPQTDEEIEKAYGILPPSQSYVLLTPQASDDSVRMSGEDFMRNFNQNDYIVQKGIDIVEFLQDTSGDAAKALSAQGLYAGSNTFSARLGGNSGDAIIGSFNEDSTIKSLMFTALCDDKQKPDPGITAAMYFLMATNPDFTLAQIKDFILAGSGKIIRIHGVQYKYAYDAYSNGVNKITVLVQY